MGRAVDATLAGPGIFATEHSRLLGYLTRAGDKPEAPPTATLREQYAPDVAEAACINWRIRMINEHRSSGVFAGLQPQLMMAGSAFSTQTVVLRMAMDEIHHAELCGRVVTAFGGVARAEAEETLTPVPMHPGLSPLERVVRNALFIGCMAETVAVALVSHERNLATEPLVRWTLDQILGDEISHARFGWQFVADALPSLDAAARARIAQYLPVAFGYLEASENTFLPIGHDRSKELSLQREALGLCEGEEARSLFVETVETVVVPKLEAMGLGAEEGWRRRVVPMAA